MRSEDEFENFLKRDTELSRIYREGAVEEAPDALDAPILADSREAIRTRSRPLRLRLPAVPFAGVRWFVPVATTAVIALAIGLVVFRPSPELDAVYTLPGQAVMDSPILPARDPRSPRSTERNGPETELPELKPDVLQEPGVDLFKTGAAAGQSGTTSEIEGTKHPSVDSPAEWLMEIERLLESGRLEEARVGFYAFRERYPYHSVADDLLARLRM